MIEQENPKELHLQLIAVDGDQERTFEVRTRSTCLGVDLPTDQSEPIDRLNFGPNPHTDTTTTTTRQTYQVRLETGYLSEALEVTGPGPNDKTPIPLTLRAPSSTSSSPWELLLAYSPVPPSLLLMSAGVAVLLMGVTLVALGGFGKGGTGKAD